MAFIARCVLELSGFGQQFRITMGVAQISGANPGGWEATLAGFISSNAEPLYLLFPDEVTLDAITITDLYGGPPYPPSVSYAVGEPGLATADPLPTQAAIWTKFVTNDPNIRRGGFYVGPLTEEACTGGLWTSTATGRVASFLDGLTADLTGEGWFHVVIRPVSPLNQTTEIATVNSYIVRDNPSTLRSRKRGVGM